MVINNSEYINMQIDCVMFYLFVTKVINNSEYINMQIDCVMLLLFVTMVMMNNKSNHLFQHLQVSTVLLPLGVVIAQC